jgi:long-chain acyl-CoA synthetase
VSNLGQNLLDTAARHEARPAPRMDVAVLTFAEFRDAALRVGAGLRARGLEARDPTGKILRRAVEVPESVGSP